MSNRKKINQQKKIRDDLEMEEMPLRKLRRRLTFSELYDEDLENNEDPGDDQDVEILDQNEERDIAPIIQLDNSLEDAENEGSAETENEVKQNKEDAAETENEVEENKEGETEDKEKYIIHQGVQRAKELPKVHALVRYRKSPEDEWENVKILSKAGTARGINWHYRNVIDTRNHKEYCMSFKDKEWQEIQDILHSKVKLNHEVEEQAELKKWRDLGVYEEVPDEGQYAINTRWVYSEKIVDEEIKRKARLVAKGYEEYSFNENTDSPTCQKESIRVMLSLIPTLDWELSSLDVMAAFLQGKPVERDIFIKPPKEANVENKLWKLKQAV